MYTESKLKCMRCGSTVPLYGTVNFICECGGLYDVAHNFNQVRNLSENWRRTFDGRTQQGPNNACALSGVWRFHELIMPSLPKKDIISLGEGLVPFWRAGNNLREWIGGELDLWLIPEGLTPTGSFKDFGGTVMISVAKKSGVKAIGCASTGDTSAMAAAYAAAAGMTCVVILPQGQVTPVQLAQPIAHGAKVVTIPGSFDDCMRIVQELVKAGRMFPANSLNPSRIEGHQATVFLTAQFFGWELPDWFVIPLGNGSNSSSIGKGVRLLQDLLLAKGKSQLLSVQSDAANPLARSWEEVQRNGYADPDSWKRAYEPQTRLGETTATATKIGRPVSYEKVMREINALNGAVLTAEEIILNEAVMIAGSDGHPVCPQTGTALAGLKQAVERGFVKTGSRVVVVSTATGLKFPEVPILYGQSSIIDLDDGACETEHVAEVLGI